MVQTFCWNTPLRGTPPFRQGYLRKWPCWNTALKKCNLDDRVRHYRLRLPKSFAQKFALLLTQRKGEGYEANKGRDSISAKLHTGCSAVSFSRLPYAISKVSTFACASFVSYIVVGETGFCQLKKIYSVLAVQQAFLFNLSTRTSVGWSGMSMGIALPLY